MASFWFNRGAFNASAEAGYQLDGAHTFKALLLTSAASPVRTNNFVSDLTNEVSVGGYSRQTITPTVAEVDASNWVLVDCGDIAFGALAASETIGWCIIFVDLAGADTANPLVCAIDVADTLTNGSAVTVTTASGIGTLST